MDSCPVLEQLMYDMISGRKPAPVQVGVWIPKAKLGPTAMPNTADRLVDGTITAVLASVPSCDECLRGTPECG